MPMQHQTFPIFLKTRESVPSTCGIIDTYWVDFLSQIGERLEFVSLFD